MSLSNTTFDHNSTDKANKLEPYAYLRFIFDKLPTATTLEDYEALLPWNVKKQLDLAD